MQKKIIIIGVLFLSLAILVYSFFPKESDAMHSFSKSSIGPELRREMTRKNIWSNNCPVNLDRLSLLKVSYVDFEGVEHHDGQLIVFDVIADHVLAIFHELYLKKFPINSINLINKYDGNDEKSMRENNSSGFNCRMVKDTGIYSLHSYGMAIDINPQQNPYLLTEYEYGKVVIPVYPIGTSSQMMSVSREGQRDTASAVAAAMSAMWQSETNSRPSPGVRSLPATARPIQPSSKPVPGP